MRGLTKSAVPLAAALALASCEEGLFFDPAPPEGSAAVEIGLQLATDAAASSEPGAAFDRADQVRVAIQGLVGGEVVLDETRELSPRSGGDITQQFETNYEGPALVGAGLLFQGEFLFVGAGQGTLVNGEAIPVTIALQSIISSIKVPPPVTLQGLGRQTQLMAEAQFATGDADPGATLVYSTTSPNISVTPTGLVTAVSPGAGQVQVAWFPGAADIPQLDLSFDPVMELIDVTVELPGTVRVAPGDVGTDPLAVATLQEALNLVDEGGTIRVADGLHSVGNVVVSDPVTIEGEGTGAVIRGSTTVMSFTDGPFTLRRLRLEQLGLVSSGTTAPSGTVDQVTVAGTSGDGIRLSNTSGTFTFADTRIEGVGGISLLVDGGSPQLTFGGSIDNTMGRAVQVQNLSGGFVQIDASIDDTGTGIDLRDNSSVRITFAGGLDLRTGSSKGLHAINGGRIEVTGPGSRVTTSTGTGVELNGASIGSAGMTFESISSSGAQSGILLSGTGGLGSFTVTGDGSTLGSGGAIMSSTTSGIFINDSPGASLSFMTVTGSGSDGIEVRNSAGFTLRNSVVDASGDQPFDFGVDLRDVGGTILLETVQVRGSFTDNVFLSTGATTELRIIDSELSGSNESGLDINDFGAAGDVTVTVTNSDLIGNAQHGIQIVSNTGGGLTVALDQNDLNGNGGNGVFLDSFAGSVTRLTTDGNDIIGNGGVGIFTNVAGGLESSMFFDSVEDNDQGGVLFNLASNGTATVKLDGVDVNGVDAIPINFNSSGSSVLRGTVVGSDVTSSGDFPGLSVSASNDSRQFLSFQTNNVDKTGFGGGIQVFSGGLFGTNSAQVDLTVLNNGISRDSSYEGIFVASFTGSSVCANIQNNVVVGGAVGIVVDQLASSGFALERLNGGSGFETDPGVVEEHVLGENPGVSTAFAGISSIGFQGVPGGTCQLP